jgi:hypothetical protein
VIDKEATIAAVGDELRELKAEISRLRLLRSETTYRLEQALRECDRLTRHLASANRDEEAV